MAEPKNTQYPIPLSGQLLNTSSYEYDTKQFAGFNNLEGSYFQGCLSPLYSYSKNVDEQVLFVDNNGNEWSYGNNVVYKNGVEFKTFPKTSGLKVYNKVEIERENLLAVLPGRNPFLLYYKGKKVTLENSATQQKYEITLTNELVNTETHYHNNGLKTFVLIGGNVVLSLDSEYGTNFRKEYETTYKLSSNMFIYGYSTDEFCFRGPDEEHTFYFYNTSRNALAKHTFTTQLYGDITDKVIIKNDVILFVEKPNRVLKTANSSVTVNVPIYWTDLTLSLDTGITASNSRKIPFDNTLGTYIVDLEIKDLLITEGEVQETVTTTLQVCSESSEQVIYGGKVETFSTRDTHKVEKYLYTENLNIAGTQRLDKSGTRVLAFNGNIANVSFAENKESQGVIIEPWFEIDTSKPCLISNGLALYCKGDIGVIAKVEESEPTVKQFLNRYIVRNTVNDVNTFDTVTGKFIQLGTDCCNNFYLGKETLAASDNLTADVYILSTPLTKKENALNEVKPKLPKYRNTSRFVALSVNEQYPTTGINIVGSILNPVSAINIFDNDFIPKTILGTGINGTLSSYANLYASEDTDYSSVPAYNCSYNYTKTKDSALLGLTYPNDVNGNALLNISPVIDEIDSSYLMYTSFRLSKDKFAQLATIDGVNLLNYYFATVQYNVPITFSIAGQVYSIKGDTLYYSRVDNGIISTVQPLLNIGRMEFLGTLPLAALFFSETNKRVYLFSGDTNLSEFIDLSRYGKPLMVKTNTTSQDIMLVYNNECLIINDTGIWEVPFSSQKIFFTENSMVFINENKITNVSYYKVNENYSVVPLKINTCFYGLQNNIVSTNDCIYIRLYNPNDEEGYIRLKATTLMNDIKETDEKETKLTPKDFDKESKTFYLRFQPELQKATSESLEIETSFSVGAIIFSNQPNTALVGSTNGNVSHNF